VRIFTTCLILAATVAAASSPAAARPGIVAPADATGQALAGAGSPAAERAPEAAIAPIEDWDCRPSAAHPNPVVLVHGTGGNAQTWAPFVPSLQRAGYCVFAPNYGDGGFGFVGLYATGPIRDSAQWLSGYVDQVLGKTGAKKVAIVGHSQGGMMPRYYLRFLGGAQKVSELIGLAPSNHGTTQPLAPIFAALCAACRDQIAGSEFLQELNEGHDVEPGVDYTVVSTTLDEVVIPMASQALAGPAQRVTNVVLQDKCPLDLVEHATIIADSVAWQWTLNALGHAGPADAGFKPVCLL
jgi:triacylglycerol esterase/lipase EstA (alpha/beta hydrolase family)